MEFKDFIKDFLANKKISQEKLAKIIGVNQTTISQWILGKKKPSYDSILMLYKKFGIMPNEIFDIEN